MAEASYQHWAAWTAGPGIPAFEHQLEHLRPLLPRDAVVLEAGCGEGRYCRELAKSNQRVVGVDRRTELVRAARMRSPSIEFITADARSMPLAGEQFDAVVSVMMLQEMLDFAPAIGEMRRVLRTGGSLVVAVSHPASTMLLSTATGALTVGYEYGSRTAFVRTKTIDDLTMVYTGFQHSVAHYFNALRDNRFDITALDEVKWASDPLWSRPPRFLHLKAVAR